MQIGIPKEIKDHEFRVALTPEGVRTLCTAGHHVMLESTAGEGSGFSDEEYRNAGATLVRSHKEVFTEADLIVKVKEPLPSEYPLFHPGQTLFTFLHLAAFKDLTLALVAAKITAIAYETVEAGDGTLPLLIPMSEIAGRMAVQEGAHYLQAMQGGRGILLGGIPGVPPATVIVLGAGTVGTQAVRMAVGMGAQVTVINLDIARLRHLDDLYAGRITTLASHQEWIDEAVVKADLVIGAVMVRGARAPRLVSRSVVSRMKPGAVVVDVAVDQGGCFETTRPTTHSDPVYTVERVVHYCVANMPGIVPRTATFALTNASLPFIVRMARLGVKQALCADARFARGVNVHDGMVTYRAVAEAHRLPYKPFS